MDKGYARTLTTWGAQKVMKPLGPLAESEKFAEAMAMAGWSKEKMRKVLGENWLACLEKIFGELTNYRTFHISNEGATQVRPTHTESEIEETEE